MASVKMGFPPVFDEQSKILILGSFPSVKSREISFYYGHKQNRFWKMLSKIFGEEIPVDSIGKHSFLIAKGIALWDMVTECEIEGSSDSSVANPKIADLSLIFKTAKIERILLNGTLAFTLFEKSYADCGIPYFKMPSTSPANPRFDENVWRGQFDDLL